ncbi:MAG: PIG-L family deacetylase [Sedimentisphaerales bacterium]|nr:PIG-L family deacetylase [Sedimentisphaerales bacterium]
MSDSKIALSFCCHPDDTEFTTAGTLALLRQKGWQIHIATMANGNCGSAELGPDEISKIRYQEGVAAAAILDAPYHCANQDDVFVLYDRPAILAAIKIVRQVKPTLVFAPSPVDYMADHEITSQLVKTACFTAGIPNIKTDDIPPYHHVPHLYYADPMDGVDNFGQQIKPSMLIDITTVAQTKEKMLCCHASQRNWLLEHHGMDQYVISMKQTDQQRGKKVNVQYAEGFRQHLGHAYPKTNLLKEELGNLAHNLEQ